jgi:hypothetical protein
MQMGMHSAAPDADAPFLFSRSKVFVRNANKL